jgi:hypothetical protein
LRCRSSREQSRKLKAFVGRETGTPILLEARGGIYTFDADRTHDLQLVAESISSIIAICQSVDFGGASGTRLADSLIFLPPLPPHAQRCAFTAELSIRTCAGWPAEATGRPTHGGRRAPSLKLKNMNHPTSCVLKSVTTLRCAGDNGFNQSRGKSGRFIGFNRRAMFEMLNHIPKPAIGPDD